MEFEAIHGRIALDMRTNLTPASHLMSAPVSFTTITLSLTHCSHPSNSVSQYSQEYNSDSLGIL